MNKKMIQIVLIGFMFFLNSMAAMSTPKVDPYYKVERNITWQEENNLRADFYRVTSESATPLVIIIPGGSWRIGKKEDMAFFGKTLAEAGMSSIIIDIRSIDDVTAEDQYGDVRGIIDVVTNNAEYLNIDPARIAVLGASSGGHLSAMLATEKNSKVKAAVLLWAPTNLASTNAELSRPGGAVIQNYMGSLDPTDRNKLFSPLFRLNATVCHTWLIVHGDNDQIVPVAQSRVFQSILKSADHNVQYLELKGQGHAQLDKRAQEFTTNNIVSFLRNNLGLMELNEDLPLDSPEAAIELSAANDQPKQKEPTQIEKYLMRPKVNP